MIGMFNHLLSIVFRFHYHSQEVIGSLGHGWDTPKIPYSNPLKPEIPLNQVPSIFFSGGSGWCYSSFQEPWGSKSTIKRMGSNTKDQKILVGIYIQSTIPRDGLILMVGLTSRENAYVCLTKKHAHQIILPIVIGY